ncbi:MAG: hypothetical protein ACTSYU_05560 [Promethearchaeota archaeon]
MRLNKRIILKKFMFAVFLASIFVSNTIISSDFTSRGLESTEKEEINLSPQKDLESNRVDYPQSAAESDTFYNGLLFFMIDDYGTIDDTYWNLWFEGLYHDYNTTSFLSINEGTVYCLNEFNIIETRTNISSYEEGNFELPILVEVILEHPVDDVQLKIHVKLYPDKEYFIMTFYISSQTLDEYRAEFFMFADLDIDETWDDDFAGFDDNFKYIFQTDPATDNTVGWSSQVDPVDWGIGSPDTVKSNVESDKLKQSQPSGYQDYGIATKYENTSLLQIGETWGIPIIFGFGVDETDFKSNTYNVQDQFVDDFAVLDFSTNLSVNPSLNATILNGGIKSETRSITVLVNGTEVASSSITLSPGEYGTVSIDILGLIPGQDNEISVVVENFGNEFTTNNIMTKTFLYNRKIDIHVIDLEGNNIENVNVSIYNQTGGTYLFSDLTNSGGLGEFSNILDGDYTTKIIFPWIQNQTLQCVSETNFSVPGVLDVVEIQTNTNTFTLQILDLEDNPVKNASISIFNNETSDFLWKGTTDSQGNITFHYLNSSFDIFIDYQKYQHTLNLWEIQDLHLSSPTYLTQNVNLINLTLHFTTRDFQEDMTGAKIEFYNRTAGDSFGELIGYEIADENGNVTIQWTNSIDYAITVSFFSEPKKIGDPEADAYNFTGSPFFSYLYKNLNVTLGGGGTVEDFTTELVLFNQLPIKYIWNDLIDLKFMFNVTGPSGYEGPIWANETIIVIRDSQYKVVYLGNASIIPTQQGNHSFIVNTSSGYFSSGNPETYSIEISAEVYGYISPISINVNFNIYNISTQLALVEPSTSIIWKDNFTITVSYNDTVNDIPIIGATVTATWNEYLINAPLDMTSPGIYSITIDSSIGIPGSDYVIINAMRPHYNQRSTEFGVSIDFIPTTINETYPLYYSEHFLYVTVENLTLDYAFYDSYRNISIPNLNVTTQLVHSSTNDLIEGTLSYYNGMYEFDPHTTSLTVGTYNGFIEFQEFGYISSYASIQIIIADIPTGLNNSQLEDTPVNLFALSPFRVDFNFTDVITNNSIEFALTTFEITDTNSSVVVQDGSLSEILPGIYEFSPNTENFPIGNYRIEISFSKANYSSISTEFLMFIDLIPTSVNDTQLLDIPYDLYYGEALSFNFQFFDEFRSTSIGEISPSYNITQIEDSVIIDDFQGALSLTGIDEYGFQPNFLAFQLGTYFVEISFVKQNYTGYNVEFSFIISAIPTSVNDTQLLDIPYELYYGESLSFNFQFYDTYRNISIGEFSPYYNITQIENSEIINEFQENLPLIGLDEYGFQPNFLVFQLGTYFVEISFVKQNYTTYIVEFSFVISAIPTSVNDTSLLEIPYILYYGDSLQFSFQFFDSYRNISVGNITPSYTITQIENLETITEYFGFLNELVDNEYLFAHNFLIFPIGTYTVEIEFAKQNHTTYFVDFDFEIRPILTQINATDISTIPYELYIGDHLEFEFLYEKSILSEPILYGQANYTIFLASGDADWLVSNNLGDLGTGRYQFNPSTENWLNGTYQILIQFSKDNHTQQSISFSIRISEIPFSLNITESLRDTDLSGDSNELRIILEESILIEIETQNIWGYEVEDCVVTYTISKDDQIWEGEAIMLEDGRYLVNISIFEDPGIYSMTIRVSKTNYTTEEFQLFINAEYQTFLGIATPYWLIIGIASAVLVSSVVGYISIRNARIPRYIKNLTLLEKLMRKPKSEIPDRFLTRADQIQAKYGSRWTTLDLDPPFKSTGDSVGAFIQKYNEATGKMLITEDAIQYLNNASIYSQSDIKTRLNKEGVHSEELMIDILELISNYIQDLSQTGNKLEDSSELSDDIGFDWDLNDNSNQNKGGNQ